MENLNLSQVGFGFEDVRTVAKKQASGSTDFAGLFAGLSMFLIFSAAVLLALMFVFYVESRTQQIGLLTAVGWSGWRIFALFLAEGACVAIAGCVVGAIVSVIYTAALIFVLNATFWAQALASLQLSFYMSPVTLIKGIAVSFVICIFAIQLSLFHRIRRPAHQLLTGITERYTKSGKSRSWLLSLLGWVCLLAGIFISLKSEAGQGQVATFFTAGTLCLVGLILIAAGLLRWLRLKSRSFVKSISSLAVRSIPRRTGRSTAVLVALACGVFMVIGVGASYKDVGADVQDSNSGTGGFALLARTTLPVTEPLEWGAVSFVPMRLYQQDEASCLNLNKARQPSLLGVRPGDLAVRKAFTFRQFDTSDNASAWRLLDPPLDENTIPAIGDYATVFWGLGKKLGDTIPYKTENGGTINLKVVGILEESTVQGRLFISEDNFVRCFPSVDGSQQFFIDSDWQHQDQQGKLLMKKYRDVGMEVVSSEQILAQYHEVENTYLAIFLVLGGLGLVLGSAGLALVVVLNVIDRKGELAMMQAVGFRKPSLKKMLFIEHGLLLLAGLFCGAVPALWAVFPSIITRGGAFPYVQIGFIIFAILISGIVWICVAVSGVLKSDFMDLLRNE
ncbi:MAG: FtsX-like permease family protein [Planctomycetota bacterium]